MMNDYPTPNPIPAFAPTRSLSPQRGGETFRTCKNCGRELPEEQFELYPTGTRRRICRHCHYELHTKAGHRKWVMKQRARVVVGKR